MEPLSAILLNIGCGVAANAISAGIKRIFQEKEQVSIEELKSELDKLIDINGANVTADAIITFLASKGMITIEGTTIYAEEGIRYTSNINSAIKISGNTVSETSGTKITVGKSAVIELKGGGSIVQGGTGNIEFRT